MILDSADQKKMLTQLVDGMTIQSTGAEIAGAAARVQALRIALSNAEVHEELVEEVEEE